ncbi:endonuclease/exonuclease/phosphatase family protein [Nocardioides sp. L-11A]|uniref:endonuclease/exonuclease/phosphatase family protein n=1 Tax=Nocardioides sp. L-11A TaxID=3043848 RepID=UPI00249BB6A6|nr:hypothetical protein QJ852_09760 [Nocardioides sp. L-11A]
MIRRTWAGARQLLRRAARPGRPVALSANLLVGRRRRRVRRALRKHLRRRAQVVALQEAGGYLDLIDDAAKEEGYRPPIHAKPTAGRGMDSSVLLFRDDVPVYAQGVALVRAPWTGPRLKIRWPGRGIPWGVADLDVAGQVHRTLVASIHGPWGYDRGNARSWRRYLRRLRRMARRLAKRHGATHVLFLGDWNCSSVAVDELSVRRLLADRIDADIVRTGTPIDYLVTDLDLVGKKGPRRGSDHHSIEGREAA